MNRYLVGVVCLLTAGLAACGGSTPPAGQALAQQACLSAGTQAASYAAQAAKANTRFAGLSTDENALAASEATDQSELSDGNGSDDSGLGALAGAESAGSGPDLKVITDCVSLGLTVKH